MRLYALVNPEILRPSLAPSTRSPKRAAQQRAQGLNVTYYHLVSQRRPSIYAPKMQAGPFLGGRASKHEDRPVMMLPHL